METNQKISDAELRIMRVLWSRSPLTANEVVKVLSSETDWNHRTIRTLLARLAKKQALGVSKEDREFQYVPLVAEAEVLKSERTTFVRRVYNGAVLPMLAAFLEDEHLSEGDVERLKRILDKRKGADDGSTA